MEPFGGLWRGILLVSCFCFRFWAMREAIIRLKSFWSQVVLADLFARLKFTFSLPGVWTSYVLGPV